MNKFKYIFEDKASFSVVLVARVFLYSRHIMFLQLELSGTSLKRSRFLLVRRVRVSK